MRLISDKEARAFGPAEAVAAMRAALVSFATGELSSPPRHSGTFAGRRVLFSGGGWSDGALGLRVSGPATTPLEHVTVTWLPNGEVDAVVVGNEVGARRAGAVAAVAADLFAAPGPVKVGIVGSGRNGWSQVWGLCGARQVAELDVYSPNPEHRAGFAARARDELGLEARDVAEARLAVMDKDVVVLCTTSQTPVIESRWVRDGAHVTSIGPKSVRAHECPPELLLRAGEVASDAPEELGDSVVGLAGVPLVSLGSLLVAGCAPTRSGEVSAFLYSGLGGTDAAYGRALAAHATGLVVER